MSVNDFNHCDPDELEAIFKAYAEAKSEANRDEWERMRLLATISIQPHVRRKITPQKLLPLPWDNDKKKAATQKATAESLSPEDRLKRFESFVKKNK